ncbi:MAG: 50S ribosomal protein L11 methyltransferase [Actinomycetota bacterium]
MTEPDGWTLTEFQVPDDLAEVVSDLLWAGGVAAVEETQRDGGVVLRTSVDPSVVSAVLKSHPGVTATETWVSSTVADTWREHAVPVHVQGDAWLVPAWTDPPPGARSILIEPFDTFGLGNHPTTVLALRAALAVAAEGGTVLDVGSGSGVLSVAMSVLRGCACTATDIAPQARPALEFNATKNGVAGRIHWVDDLSQVAPGAYTTVVANILAPVLRDLAPMLEEACAIGGHIVLSGLRADQEDGVVACYPGSRVVSREVSEGWAAVTLARG